MPVSSFAETPDEAPPVAAEGDNGEGDNGEGYNGEGANGEGQNGEGYNGEGYNGEGQNGEGYNGEGQNGEGYNGEGQNGEGYNGEGENGEGYNGEGENGAASTPNQTAPAVPAGEVLEIAYGMSLEHIQELLLELFPTVTVVEPLQSLVLTVSVYLWENTSGYDPEDTEVGNTYVFTAAEFSVSGGEYPEMQPPYVLVEVVEPVGITATSLVAPTGFGFAYENSGVQPANVTSTLGPVVYNGNRALTWGTVQNADGYIIYAFTEENEMDPAMAYRSQFVTEPWILIGHDTVVQARTRFNDIAPGFVVGTTGGHNNPVHEQLLYPNLPVHPDNGELSWGAFLGAARQGFDLPLPYRDFHFRVVAVELDVNGEIINESPMSTTTILTRPGARSASAPQSKALIADALDRGAAYPGFVFVHIGTVGDVGGSVFGNIMVPMPNTTTPNPDRLSADPANIDAATNRSSLARISIEIQNHPAYIGEDTLIFFG